MEKKELAKSLLITVGVLLATILICLHLAGFFDDNNPFAVPMFVLAVAIIARFTTGYFFGIASSVIGVICVNYIFTYPFWEFDMTISGYPLTFSVMLIVSLLISTLTTQMKSQERLRYEARTEKMRADLLRSVSHDFRTPLASIIGASSALLENSAMPQPDRRELLEEIQKDALGLTRMCENILSVTRFSGRMKIETTDEILEEIIGSAIVKFRRTSKIPVQVVKPDEILIVPMDATLIGQVILNLLENVVYHAETATKIILTVTAEPKRVTISVSDNGCGFSKKQLSQIFEKGVGISTRANPDGRRSMGIGLSVCRSIVLAHGGEMTARNNPEQGATISFWLPRPEEEET